MALHINQVFLGMLVTWMSQQIGQLAVVGEQDQPFAIQVQAAYRVELTWNWHQVTHCAMAACVVPCSGENTSRLIESEIVQRMICPHWPTIHRDSVAIREDLLAEPGHLPVDDDTLLTDQFLTRPAGTKTGTSQNFL
jgi:hypothetical protein